MPYETKDIGNGVQQLVFTPDKGSDLPDPLELQKNRLGLIELGQRVEQNAVEAQIKNAELRLKQNDIDQIGVMNQKRQWDLIASQNEELRKQRENYTKRASALPELFLQSPELGMMEARDLGFATIPDKNGGYALARKDPATGALRAFNILPKGVVDPEKVMANTKNFRDDWTKFGEEFKVVDENFKAIQKGKEVGGGVADTAMIFAIAKILDPKSVVRDGERDAFANLTNLPGWFQNIIRRQKDPNAPVLNVAQRTQIYEEAQRRHDLGKANLLARGQDYARIAPQFGVDPKNVLVSVGSISYKDILGDDGQGAPAQGASTQLTNQPAAAPGAPAPREASVVPGASGAAPTGPTTTPTNKTKYTPDVNGLNSLFGENLMLRGSGK